MWSAAKKSGQTNQTDVVKTEKTKPNQKPEVVEDSGKKDLKQSDQVETKDDGKVETKPMKDDAEPIENFKEEVDDAAESMKQAIMDKLGITEEELLAAMQAMGLTMQDLFNPDNIMNLMTELTGNADVTALLTDETLYADVKELMQMAEELTTDIQEQFGMTDESRDTG